MKYLAILAAIVVLFPWRVVAALVIIIVLFKVAGLFINPTSTTLGGSGGSKWGSN